VALVVFAVLRGAMAYLSTVGMAIAATRVLTEVRSNLYAHIQRLCLSFHNKAKTGDLITRVTYDIDRLGEVTVIAALPLLTNILTISRWKSFFRGDRTCPKMTSKHHFYQY
jgi:ATP-binding cassette subfamily B protein